MPNQYTRFKTTDLANQLTDSTTDTLFQTFVWTILTHHSPLTNHARLSQIYVKTLQRKPRDAKGNEVSAIIKLRITAEHNVEETMLDLERLLLINNGDIPVRIYLPDGRQIAPKHGASLSDFFVETLERMLGKENVKMQGISEKEKD